MHQEDILNLIIEKCTHTNLLNAKYELFPDLIGICINEKSAINAITQFISNRIIIGNFDEIAITRTSDTTKIEYAYTEQKYNNDCSALGSFMMINSIIKTYTSNCNMKISFTGDFHDKNKSINNIFKNKCLFNQNKNQIIIENHSIENENPFFNPNLHSIQINTLNNKTKKINRDNSLSVHVSKIIEKTITSIDSISELNIMSIVCSTLNMSRWTLNEKLRAENTSFSELLKSVKIKKACLLLRETNLSIQEISELVLFSSQSVFSRFFKANLNISPLSYRNKNNIKSQL